VAAEPEVFVSVSVASGLSLGIAAFVAEPEVASVAAEFSDEVAAFAAVSAVVFAAADIAAVAFAAAV
jgi:hypothetical protein